MALWEHPFDQVYKWMLLFIATLTDHHVVVLDEVQGPEYEDLWKSIENWKLI